MITPTPAQVETLRSLCDTIVPSLERREDPDGFWARSASDVDADTHVMDMVVRLPEEQAAGLLQLLDVLSSLDFARLSPASREQTLENLTLASTDASAGIAALRALTLLFTYSAVDPDTGTNPNWKTFGYPGPLSAPPHAEKTIEPLRLKQDTVLECDVVVVGSGSGGGVIAGKLAKAGLKVTVVEMGGYYNEADFNQQENWAREHLYWRGNLTQTAEGNVGIQAASCLGGGSTVNWTNSLRTKDWVREEWATEHGLTDVATPAFDRHLDDIWERLKVNDRCSELNGSQQAMKRGADKLGWSFAQTHRNWDPAKHDPAVAGYMGFGDQSGAKQGTLVTYLQDAADHGADFLVGCFAERVIVEAGRAAGIEGSWTDPETGVSVRVTVRAPQVVVAAGALETPGILLRSGIGGPAAGKYLRLHPCSMAFAVYPEDLQAWWGAPHAALINEFANADGHGYGYLIEGTQYVTGLGAVALPYVNAQAHKAIMHDYRHAAGTIGLVRDRGHGEVRLDDNGQAVPWYPVSDPRDVAHLAAALEAQIRVHAAAGAHRVTALAAGNPTWRVGDDLEEFIERVCRIPARAGGLVLFSAHQMGSARMGADPQTSVADPHGQLHDVPGVWIGDGSAFPTPSGTNPMITVMALASRTADFIAEAAGAGMQNSKQEVHA